MGAMPSSSVETDNPAAAAVVQSSPAVDERLVSSLRAQAEVDMLCKKHGVPSLYTARPAGDDRRASTPPPPLSVCVYAHALEAGMRVPLDGFFCEVLAHFGIAPAQLVPNAWRVMAGYLALCRSAGVPPSLAVFRRFFLLTIVNNKLKGWYCFRARDSSGLRITGLPFTPMDWRKLFFFLSSPEPWPCPVEWGEPSQSSFINPALTSEERRSAAKILDVYGATVDISTCMCDGNPAGAMETAASTPPPPASSSTSITSSSSKGMDPSVFNLMKTMLAEKAAAQAAASTAKKVKPEPGSNAPEIPPLCGKKRSLDEANGEEQNPPPSYTPLSAVCSPPPGFPRTPQHIPSRSRGGTTDWKAARELLQGAVAPAQERVFASSEPSDVLRSSYAAILQAVNCTTFSLSYTLELEEKLVARDAEVAALREQLEEAKAELATRANADAKRAALEAQLEKAVQHVLGNGEHARRCAEHAMDGYERWRDDSPAHVTASPTTTSTPMMQTGGGHKRRPEPSTKYDPKQWLL